MFCDPDTSFRPLVMSRVHQIEQRGTDEYSIAIRFLPSIDYGLVGSKSKGSSLTIGVERSFDDESRVLRPPKNPIWG